jgi:hypothetical protein
MNLYKYHSKPETLDHYDKADEWVPTLAWDKYKDQPAELKKREKALAKNPKIAYFYALDVLKKPFPAGEAAIAKSMWSYNYAIDVLKLSHGEAKKWGKT